MLVVVEKYFQVREQVLRWVFKETRGVKNVLCKYTGVEKSFLPPPFFKLPFQRTQVINQNNSQDFRGFSTIKRQRQHNTGVGSWGAAAALQILFRNSIYRKSREMEKHHTLRVFASEQFPLLPSSLNLWWESSGSSTNVPRASGLPWLSLQVAQTPTTYLMFVFL